MKRLAALVALVLMIAGVIGCQKKHPVKVRVSPRMKTGQINSIAIFPFASSLHETDDPENAAPKMIESFFLKQLENRRDYKFVTPETVGFAVDKLGLEDRNARFLREWPHTQKPDMDFLKAVAGVLKCDAFLIGTVDLWQKDEVDYQENASSATYVGATITILDASSGEVLFQASDENYIEGLRSETTDRRIVTGASGNLYKDLGEQVYKAPPFDDVALEVVKALASSIPNR